MNIQEFYSWERSSRETIDFKTIYVDVADDLLAGLLLSQIVYWFMPDRNGKSKVRVQREGRRWMAKKNSDWYEEIRLTEAQARRAVGLLKKKGIVDVKCFKFAGIPTTHISLNENILLDLIKKQHIEHLNETQSDLSHSTSSFESQHKSICHTAQVHLSYSTSPYTETTNRDYKQRLLKEEEMIVSDSSTENTKAPEPDESGMCEIENDNSGELFWKKYKRSKSKGSKRNFLTAWKKLSSKTKQSAEEHYDNLVIYFSEWKNGEEGIPWPENFVKRKYWTHDIDFASLTPQSGKAQQGRLASGAVDNSTVTLTQTNGQWSQQSEGKALITDEEQANKDFAEDLWNKVLNREI